MCRKNASFKIFVIVIPEEGLTGQIVMYETDYEIYSVKILLLVSYQKEIPKVGMVRPHPPILLLV